MPTMCAWCLYVDNNVKCMRLKLRGFWHILFLSMNAFIRIFIVTHFVFGEINCRSFSGLVVAQAPNGNFRRKPGRTNNRATTTEKPQPIDDGESSDCPEPYGFFADAEQCDKYYACK